MDQQVFHRGESLEKRAESSNTYYRNVRRSHGRGLFRRELTPEIIARFAPKFLKSSGCWLWQAGTFKNGYGQFALDRQSGKLRVTQAHRVSFVLFTGADVPPGAVVMHSCDVPACVNPTHLSLGSQADNIADAVAKGKFDRPRTVGSVRWKREQRRQAGAGGSP